MMRLRAAQREDAPLFFTVFLRNCSRIPTAASEALKSNQKASKQYLLSADR